MKTSKLLIVLALLVSISAVAAPRTIIRAYEVPLDLFRVPVTMNDEIPIRQCAHCEAVEARLTAATELLINGERVTIREFREEIFQLRDRTRYTIIVRHHLESDTVTSISVKI